MSDLNMEWYSSVQVNIQAAASSLTLPLNAARDTASESRPP